MTPNGLIFWPLTVLRRHRIRATPRYTQFIYINTDFLVLLAMLQLEGKPFYTQFLFVLVFARASPLPLLPCSSFSRIESRNVRHGEKNFGRVKKRKSVFLTKEKFNIDGFE